MNIIPINASICDYQPWVLRMVIEKLPVECAGRLMSVSADWERTIREAWRIKPIIMANGMNINIWVEVNGLNTYPKWKCRVMIATGSLKFMRYMNSGNLELLCAQAIANHTQKSTLMADFSPLMHQPDIKKRLQLL